MRVPWHALRPPSLFARLSPASSCPPSDPVASAVPDRLLQCRSLAHAKQAHAQAAVSGLLLCHLPITSSLLLSYAEHGAPAASIRLFDDSPFKLRGPFLWNTLVRALSRSGLHDSSLSVYNGMLRAGLRPDDRTFPFVFTVAAVAVQARKGWELHGSVIKFGFLDDVFVGNTLLMFYCAVNDVCSARQVFGEMVHKDIVSWNSIISVLSSSGMYAEAVRSISEIKRCGFTLDSVTLISSLPACAALQDEDFGQGIHGVSIKHGLDSVVRVGNALIDMYGKCGDSEASLRVFNSMQEKNDVSWNSLIGSLIHVGRYEDALKTFKNMHANNAEPNSITISTLLPTVVELESFSIGQEIHGYVLRHYLDSDIFVANSLLDMYAKSGFHSKGSHIFYRMHNRNVVSWNTIIASFTQNGAELKAIKLVMEMQDHGERPDSVTYTNVLPACARIASLKKGKEIHARAIRFGFDYDLFVSNALIDMYVKCGRFNLGWSTFDVSKRDHVSYNTLISGFSDSPWCAKALDLFVDMQYVGLEHDVVSFVGALSACANLSAIKQGKEIHCLSIKKSINTHLFVANSLLDVYTKCGKLDLGRKIFDRMSNKDAASWNAMILGHGMQGELDTAINLFDLMKDEGVKYDHVSYIAVLSACSHAGLVERGKRYFDEMLGQNIKPTQMHYACMVDLLGRAGQMKEALELIKNMPFEADFNVWGALLGACRIHGNLEFAKLAAEHLFELKPEHSGYYILLSNMYAEAGRWDESNQIRALMKLRKVKKNPAYSWVQSGNKLHAFLVGEGSEGPELEPCYDTLVECERISSACP
ncbi:putative pentatricopeptide repeat-containing protein At3g01580 [Curcuma longa]|uniref:putative pentatricopeptide repeat-containing protein At3g01580 n=1 Tax=Curcuma longa TaxID=136217 RepID=UPI003D9F78D3